MYVPMDPAILRHYFDKFDKDGSGFLERSEAVAALTSIGSKLKVDDLDDDGDGKISFEEFLVFSTLSGKHTHPIFKSASTNTSTSGSSKQISVKKGSAHLNQAFMQSASKSWRKLSAGKRFDHDELARAFKAIDIDQSGYLDDGEIRLAIKNVAPQISEVDITLMLATSDIDGNGKITLEEWSKLMLYDHESDVPYWEKYGERDMNVGLKDRRKSTHKPKRRNKAAIDAAKSVALG